jgi:hypothetical protein
MKETTTYGYQNNAPVPQKKKKKKKLSIYLLPKTHVNMNMAPYMTKGVFQM